MLTLYTSGYNYSKRRCAEIIEWFVSKYLPKHKIEITVNHRGMLRDGVYGWVGVSDCNWRPRSFEIELHNRMKSDHYTQTLLHELWHVYQHVKGSLKDKRGKRYWRGIDHSDTDYSEQPWEVQAYEMESVLFKDYMNIEDSITFFPNRLTTR